MSEVSCGDGPSQTKAEDLLELLLAQPTDDEDAAYYSQLCENLGGKVSCFIREGEVILIEEPILSLQDVDNRIEAFVCSHCLRHAGSVEDQLHWYLLNKDSLTEEETALTRGFEQKAIDLPKLDASENGAIAYCTCGAVYCSQECRAEAAAGSHQYLCTKQLSPHTGRVDVDAERLSNLENFCTATNPSLLLAVQGLVMTMGRALALSTQDASLEAAKAWSPFWHAWRPVWWDCVPCPEDVPDDQHFRTELEDFVTEASKQLQMAIQCPQFQLLFSPQVMGSLMGMIEQNNVTISIPSPLESYIDRLNEANDRLVQSLWEQFPGLKDTLLEAARYPAQGSGYFPVGCCANHSCCPNGQDVKIPGVHTTHALVLTATSDIAAGEEITLSYIDEDAPYAERRDALRDYGFFCGCRKCD